MKSGRKASEKRSRFLSLLDQATVQTPLYVCHEIARAEDRKGMNGRWGGVEGVDFWFYWRMGDEGEIDGGGKGSRELIRDCQQILLTVAFRPGTSRRRWRPRCCRIGNWSEERVKTFVREQVRFMSEARRLCFRWLATNDERRNGRNSARTVNFRIKSNFNTTRAKAI